MLLSLTGINFNFICSKVSWIIEHLPVCSCHATYAIQSKSTLYSCLNVKELLTRSRREIWSLSDFNWTRTQNHLVRNRTLNHLAKLVRLRIMFYILYFDLARKWFWVWVQLQSLEHLPFAEIGQKLNNTQSQYFFSTTTSTLQKLRKRQKVLTARC